MLKRKISIIALLSCLGVSAGPPVLAEGLAGSYLAARSAGNIFDFETAGQFYTRALARDPTNPILMENAILSFIGTGEIDRAIPIARLLKQVNPKDQISNMLLLAELIDNSDYDGAFDFLSEGEAVGPLVDDLAMAWIQIGRGKMSEATAIFEDIAERKGLRSFGMYHKALALTIVGDLETADEILSGRNGSGLSLTRRGVVAHLEVLSQLERNEDAVALIDSVFGTDLDPGLREIRARLAAGETLPLATVTDAREGVAEVYFTVAGALMGEANDSYTLLYTRTAEFIRPDHVDSILLTAQMLEQLDRHELATQAYDRIPRSDPSFHAAELGRSEALRQSGNTDAAIEVLKQLSEDFADQANVHIALGDMLRRLKRYPEAVRAYDQAIALDSTPDASNWAVYFARGITLERSDEWERAEADFRKALELQPDQPQVLNYLGYSLVELQQNLDEALDMIERAVEARPNDGYITDSLGWVLYRLGRYEEAVGHMERAAELEPVDPIVNDHLGDVYWAVGRQREAEFQWYRALSFEPEDEDAQRIRQKLAVGLDMVLKDEGGDPIQASNDG